MSGVCSREQGENPGANTDAGYEEEREPPPLNSQYVRVSDAGGEEAAHHPACAAIRLPHCALLLSPCLSAGTLSNASLRPPMPAAQVGHIRFVIQASASTRSYMLQMALGHCTRGVRLSCHTEVTTGSIGSSPKLEVRKSSPKALPLAEAEYTSAMSDCTQGITSAKPRPFHALKLIACMACGINEHARAHDPAKLHLEASMIIIRPFQTSGTFLSDHVFVAKNL